MNFGGYGANKTGAAQCETMAEFVGQQGLKDVSEGTVRRIASVVA